MAKEMCEQLRTETNETEIARICEALVSECTDKSNGDLRKHECIEENIIQMLVPLLTSEDETVVRSSGRLLRCLVTNFPDAQEKAIQLGLGDVVARQLMKYTAVPEISGVLSSSLWGMADYNDASALVNRTVVDALCKALETDKTFPLISAVGALLTLADDDSFVRLIEKSTIMEKIAHIIPLAENDGTLARLIGGFLCNAAGEARTQQQFDANGGTEALMKLLGIYKDNDTVLSRLLLGLRALSNDDMGVLEKILSLSEEIEEAVKGKHDESVVIPLLGIIFNFTQTDDKEMEVHRRCTSIVIQYIDTSAEAAKLALGYLMNLSTSDEVAESMANTRDLTVKVQKALEKFGDVEKVVSRGCGFIQNISDFDDGRVAILESGITKDVVRVFESNKDNAEVAKACLSAITNMSQEDVLALEIVKEGATKGISYILENRKEDELLRLALICVINITSSDDVEPYIDSAWPVDVLTVLESCKEPIIKEKSVTAICGMSLIEKFKGPLVSNGVITALARAFHVSKITRNKALNALFALSGEPGVPQMIVDAHVIESAADIATTATSNAENFCGLIANCAKDKSVHSALTQFVGDILSIIKAKASQKAVTFGINAIINLCSEQSTREAIRSEPIVPVITKSIEDFMDVEPVIQSGWSALGNASIDEEIKKQLDGENVFELWEKTAEKYRKTSEVVKEKLVNFLVSACNKSDDNKRIVQSKLGAYLKDFEGAEEEGRTKMVLKRLNEAIEQ